MRKVILHLTDLHFGWDGNDLNRLTDRKLCLNGLNDTISRLEPDWCPNIICISGDVGWKGLEKDYIEAKGWLDELLNITKLNYNSVLVCAGNHDAERAKTQSINRPNSLDDAQNLLRIPISTEMQNVFQNFSKFCETSGILPYMAGTEYSYLWGERMLDGIRFVTLNSSWFCKDDKDKDSLWLGQQLLNYLEVNGQFPEITDSATPPPTVIMMHHPFEWLHSDEIHGFNNRINTKDYIAHRGHILITGHEHGEPRKLDKIAEGMYHSKGGATYSGGNYNNNARLFSFENNNLAYRSLIYDPGSPSREWKITDTNSVSINMPTFHSSVRKSHPNALNAPLGLPKKLNAVPIDHGEFLGRDEDLSNLSRVMTDSPKLVLVNGLGGIGKTTLAKRFVSSQLLKFDHIIWISVSDSKFEMEPGHNFKQAFIENSLLFENLGLPFMVVGESEKAKFSRLMNSIRNLKGDNLLVIDNVGSEVDKREIKDELPTPPNWKVLLTSRRKPVGFTIFELEKINREVSIELFFSYFNYPCDRAKVMELLEEVDYHTLTVELLAKTMQAHYGALSVEYLLEKIRGRQLDDPNIQRPIDTEHTEETEVYQNLRAVFDISKLSSAELQLLKQMTLLPPGPYSINDNIAVALQITLEEDLKTLHATIISLSKKGWLKVSGPFIEMHKMVHQMIGYQVQVGWDDASVFVDFFASSLNYNYYELPKDSWGYAPFAQFLIDELDRTEQLEYHDELNSLKNNLAAIYKETGRFELARKIMDNVVEDATKHLPLGHPKIVQYKNTLGLLYKNLKNYKKSEELLTQVVKESMEDSGTSEFIKMTYKSNLALLYKDQSRTSKALTLYESALADAISLSGEESLETARCIANISTIHQDLNNHPKAALFLEQALRIFQEKLPPNHPDIARNQGNLSLSYQKLGRFNEAINLSKRALQAAEDYYGKRHHTYISRMKHLGVAYFRAGQMTKSLETFQLALGIAREALGETHSITQSIKYDIHKLTCRTL